MKKEVKYCEVCGTKKIIRKIEEDLFDAKTGKKRIDYRYICPNVNGKCFVSCYDNGGHNFKNSDSIWTALFGFIKDFKGDRCTKCGCYAFDY